jgi:hypothetical protein
MKQRQNSEPVDISNRHDRLMHPPEERSADDLLTKLLSVKWPMAPDPQEPDDDRRTD